VGAPVRVDATGILWSKHKPTPESLVKEKTLKRVREGSASVTNANWNDSDDFTFLSSTLVRTPLRFARPHVVDPNFYARLTDAIKKLTYDPRTKTAEIIGEAGGLTMHSWLKMDDRLWDEVHFTIIKGDLKGMRIRTYLWEESGKTLIIGKGELKNARSKFGGLVARVLPTVAEVVIDVATGRFRGYIEEEYQKKRL